MMEVATPNRVKKYYRMSPNDAWPLRCADGRTFAERKAQEKDEKNVKN